MKIGRLDIGLWKYAKNNRWTLRERYFEISHTKSLCGCHIVTISKICITWMGDECYFNPPENEE